MKKRLLSILLTVLLVIPMFQMTSVRAIGPFTVGDTFYFGTYPQSRVTDSVTLLQLNDMLANTPTPWHSYRYYVLGNQADYMRYVDYTLNGTKYRAVHIDSYRPLESVDPYPVASGDQYDNAYYNDAANNNLIYWFRFDPVEWRVLDPVAGLVVSEIVLDSQAFRDTCDFVNNEAYADVVNNIYANNYEYSSIRDWLNGISYNGGNATSYSFIDTAFSPTDQQSIIQSNINTVVLTNLTNAVPTFSNVVTNDKIFLLSYDELTNPNYLFDPSDQAFDTQRQTTGSDYAKCMGMMVQSTGNYIGNVAHYWTRTANAFSNQVYCVYSAGNVDLGINIRKTNAGVRPAMYVDFNTIPDPPCAHPNMGAWNTTVDATCTTDGEQQRVCPDCGFSETRTVPMLGHMMLGNWQQVSAPTCTQPGEERDYCTRTNVPCYGTHYDSRPIPALGHDGVFQYFVDATCEEPGGEYWYCNRCRTYYIEPDPNQPALGHDFQWVTVTSVTCTQAGYEEYKCTRCGLVLNTNTTPALNHDYVQVSYPSTCMQSGYEGTECRRCGDRPTGAGVYYLTIPHDFRYVDRQPTCTEEGFTGLECSYNCGTRNGGTVHAALGHIYHVDYQAPTCTENGHSKFVCGRCGDTQQQVFLAATGHDWGSWTTVIRAGIGRDGMERRRCLNDRRHTETRRISGTSVTIGGGSDFRISNYTFTISNATGINAIRFASGTLNTSDEIRNAPDRVDLNQTLIQAHTDAEGVMSYEMKRAGTYSFWVRFEGGESFVIPGLEFTEFLQELDNSEKTLDVTVKNLYGVRDFFIARGTLETYSECNNAENKIVRIMQTDDPEKAANSTTYFLDDTKAFNYRIGYDKVSESGEYTVCIRYTDTERENEFLYFSKDLPEPEVTVTGLQVKITGLDDIKNIRRARGEYATPGEVKRGDEARVYTSSVIKGADSYTLQFLEDGVYTISIEYKGGYSEVRTVEIHRLEPEMTQEGRTVTFTGLEHLNLIRYAKGNYTTSSQIKSAPGSKVVRASAVTDDTVSVTLNEPGEYTFCVQYNDNSYNYYTVSVE